MLRTTAPTGFSAACKAPPFQSRGGKSGLNLKPSLRTISLRLPEALIARFKVLANKRGVPYQSLLKVLLAERLEQEEVKQALTLRPAQSRP
jgi:hypothetical protein